MENYSRSSGDRFLVALKTRGPQTVSELGCYTGVCGEAARQQLVRLAADGLVAATSEPRGVGRPAQVWNLTPAGNARFPDRHAELAADLIESIRTEFGEEALDRLVEKRAAAARLVYADALKEAADLPDRVMKLADVRTREGYMAEAWPDGDGFLFVENHCPICAAAAACQSFCRTELETFRQVLGPGASVERTEHIIQGSRRCAYRITPASAG